MANNDEILEDRREMWGSFVRVSTWGTASIALVLVLMAIFLL